VGMSLAAPRYTVHDLEQFPNDGNRYELLGGVLLVTPGPRPAHQEVAFRLALQIGQALQLPGYAHVVTPGAVVSGPLTQLEPDILVYPARIQRTGTWADVSEHWLAVEVLSRGSRVYDREFKRDAYLALGVGEVWLVDVERQHIEVSRERGDGRIERDHFVWQSPAGVSVSINVKDVFKGTVPMDALD